MNRAEILQKATEIIGGEREDTYGGPEDSFKLIADLWTTYINVCPYTDDSEVPEYDVKIELTGEDVAIMMAMLKMARLAQAPDHKDSWVDLAGYAACGGEIGTKN